MERESDRVSRRYDNTPPGQRVFHKNKEPSDVVLGKFGTSGSQGQMPVGTNEEIHLLELQLGYRGVHNEIGKRQSFFSCCSPQSLGEEERQGQTSSNITPDGGPASSAPEECEDIRMERDNEDECLCSEGVTGMEMDSEPEHASTITNSIFPPSNTHNRCIGASFGSDTSNQQQNSGLACKVPQIRSQQIFKQQGTVGCVIGTPSFLTNNQNQQNISTSIEVGQQLCSLQHQSVECGEESQASSSKDMEVERSNEAQHNHKMDKWCCVESPIAEDGLSVPCIQECVLAHSPIPLILMVIRKAQQERAQVALLLLNWKGKNWEVLLSDSNFFSWELNYNIQELMEGPSMKKTGANLPPGKLRLILLNPSKEKVNSFGNKPNRNERFQRSLVSNADKALSNPHSMDTFSDLHVLPNNGNYADTQ
ncbi:uncharacterized protein MONOS_12258 [Monocercomonoides exilis]|uniref:uncharacterized protein n=1 Tax=Monocercomonoides exilis TaxID=2049356 RepID=UPI0035593EEC|nr:hypothetical protein MONOS_12258 [Monocercomonoides exilis]|eukprot:MONOS_12258.1-p1 / transcript=MONOS_12258.1 / gene=MONOS_12258 / organism=Monocercomonoides_exilis_PA203 / gene_product=unspecified product / transcript_product=unspecified product / location=Mono_scaffold00666:7447-8930(+) / protein_length=422 / sequence_SO=supercontig / SO=protein_coding / is_pseudo=false